jgi:hypothetical protein
LDKNFQERFKEITTGDAGNIHASPAYLHQSREPERSSEPSVEISDSIDSVNVASAIASQSKSPSRQSSPSGSSSLLPDSKRQKIDNR